MTSGSSRLTGEGMLLTSGTKQAAKDCGESHHRFLTHCIPFLFGNRYVYIQAYIYANLDMQPSLRYATLNRNRQQVIVYLWFGWSSAFQVHEIFQCLTSSLSLSIQLGFVSRVGLSKHSMQHELSVTGKLFPNLYSVLGTSNFTAHQSDPEYL